MPELNLKNFIRQFQVDMTLGVLQQLAGNADALNMPDVSKRISGKINELAKSVPMPTR